MKRLALLLALTPTLANGAVIYDEGASGDLSGNLASPTPLVLNNGANTIVGQMGDNGDTGATNGRDADYFSFIVGAGSSVTAINVDLYTFSPNDPGVSFFGYTSGSSFTGQGAGDIDGQALFNAASGDVLPSLAGGALGPGTYSFWLQETSANVVNYQLTFTQIPEPSAGIFALLGTLGIALRRRR